MRKILSLLKPGFTLIELLLVLLVVAALMFLTVRYFIIVSTNAKVAQTISKMNIITEASYTWLRGMNQSTFSSPTAISANVLIDAGLLTSGDIINPFKSSGNLIVINGGDATTSCGNDVTKVKIIVENVSQQACSSLQQKVQKQAAAACCSTDGRFSALF